MNPNVVVSDEWIRSSYTGRHHDFRSLYDYYFSDEGNHHNQVLIPPTTIGGEIETNRRGNVVGCYVLCASWNGPVVRQEETILPLFNKLLKPHQRKDTSYRTGIIQVDATDGGMDLCCGDNVDYLDTADCPPNTNVSTAPPGRKHSHRRLPCPPEKLPAILLIIRRSSMKEPDIRYMTSLSADQILSIWRDGPQCTIPDTAIVEMKQSLRSFGLEGTEFGRSVGTKTTLRSFRQPLRIFVGGDRMSVGKTSVCLGLLGNLVAMGYPPSRLGYIKPATQSESPQLVQKYCEMMGIECVPVGPIVYYRGFTRAFLAGETETTVQLLAKVEDAVDSLARDKDVVIVDGVGFPAVGSICGTDNASVALASSYPVSYSYTMDRKALGVLLVGGPGVGSAVDAYNLNATYFQRANVPVLGAVFNKLSLEGFYSLDNCKKQISMYFAQHGKGHKPFGFIPVFPKMGGADAFDHVHDFIRVFGEHFDMDDLLKAAYKVQQRQLDGSSDDSIRHSPPKTIEPPVKRLKVSLNPIRTREEIEQLAISAGAAPSA